MDYADAVVAFGEALDAAETAARDNGLSRDEIISELELRLMALKEEDDDNGS